ncbi:hypothetical protein [Comamonas squillarum]|uniref:Uncharacterized protein n=1 Tax=Comamonas squillarum TaxID=2977320 RepID=A0ABY5ZYP2_9BURK|nr:hypothetical protein [Comamonas sp. PR12]UXC19118.1 hypothetical protein N4T19_03050 [Comamonas sp. PR12]
MTRRIAIIGSGHMAAIVALVLADTRMTVVDAQEHFPAIKNRNMRSPDLNRTQNAWSGKRRRAQWKDEQQRRGRQR